jgi:CheY-like chemotaxis protein
LILEPVFSGSCLPLLECFYLIETFLLINMHSPILKQKSKKPVKNYQPLVLIVDNDFDNLLLASCVIESLGMRCAITDESEKCLDLIYDRQPDIILLDIVMPKLNGLDITRIIRQDRTLAHISIIAVTGLTRPEDQSKIIEAGCDDYLCKPYLIEELESKIHSCLKCRLS